MVCYFISALMLTEIRDILVNNSNVHFKEACEKFGVPVK